MVKATIYRASDCDHVIKQEPLKVSWSERFLDWITGGPYLKIKHYTGYKESIKDGYVFEVPKELKSTVVIEDVEPYNAGVMGSEAKVQCSTKDGFKDILVLTISVKNLSKEKVKGQRFLYISREDLYKETIKLTLDKINRLWSLIEFQ